MKNKVPQMNNTIISAKIAHITSGASGGAASVIDVEPSTLFSDTLSVLTDSWQQVKYNWIEFHFVPLNPNSTGYMASVMQDKDEGIPDGIEDLFVKGADLKAANKHIKVKHVFRPNDDSEFGKYHDTNYVTSSKELAYYLDYQQSADYSKIMYAIIATLSLNLRELKQVVAV
jgi:hypothetical protein